MTETTHTRSRRASLLGLTLQAVVFVGVLFLSRVVQSEAMHVLAWYLGTGVPLWFAAVLMFRQRELTALEALDLEELRREKRAVGAGEGIFDEQGRGPLGFRVAEARLRWMQRWLLPGFGLLHALLLAGLGIGLWLRLPQMKSESWPQPVQVPLAMILLAAVMLLLFLYSRYASGMGRVPEWQLLRACGSYMLGHALAALVVIAALGTFLYTNQRVDTFEHVVAYVLCGLLVVLSVETLFAFILEIYRPRAPETEPRAAFDSRLLGLLSEPGGIASTIAEAMNYQFGFEVSQTWFYQLLQRWFVPLLGAGVLILWLLDGIVVVQPGQHALIARWGELRNVEQPLGPGLHWKWPRPIETADIYDTGRLYQINIGFEQFDAAPAEEEIKENAGAALWTDERHWGQKHFNFLIPVPGSTAGEAPRPALLAELGQTGQAWPVNLVRMDVVVQYRIAPPGGSAASSGARLIDFVTTSVQPHEALRDLAWEEVVRFNAAHDIFALLGDKYGAAGAEIRARLARRVADLGLGLEIVYIGVQNVHPETTVAQEFRKVVGAEQEKLAAIREAQVKEDQILSAAAGDRDRAQSLAQAIAHITPSALARDSAAAVLNSAASAQVAAFQERLAALEPQFTDVTAARWRLEQARYAALQLTQEEELGLGRTRAELAAAAERVAQEEAGLRAAEAALEQVSAPLRGPSAALAEPVREAAFTHAQARAALQFWNRRIEELLPGLQGQAAALLAQAQAGRWTIEMDAAKELARVRGEREGYRAAPRVYRVREYLEILVNGIRGTRKYFLAFEPGDRQVRIRYQAEEQAGVADTDLPTRANVE